MTKQQYFVLRGYAQLSQEERDEVLLSLQEFEKGDLGSKQISYALWHISSVGLDLNLETKSNGPMANISNANICPCCKR